MKILLLGDCIATGQNMLWPEILKQPDFTIGFDPYVWEKHADRLIEWSGQPGLALAKKYLRQEEKKHSWPAHIPGCINLTVVGETFQGMHKKLKKYVAENGKPDLVLLTDFSAHHRCVVIWKDGIRHVIKRDINTLKFQQPVWPEDAYRLFVKKVISQQRFGQTYQDRKNMKSYNLLAKHLDKLEIPFRITVFRSENHGRYRNEIYCNQLLDLYKLPNNIEHCAKRLEAQKEIGEFVLKNIANIITE